MKPVRSVQLAIGIAALATTAGALSGAPKAVTASSVSPSGAELYKARCTSCHSLDANRIGPAHRGVVGRKAGTAPGFAYSRALAGSGIVWTEQNLDHWLQGPQAMVPGAKMYFMVRSPEERKAIIAYLKSQPAH